MRAPISVIIPTLNAEAALRSSLPDIYRGVEAGLIAELIISDGGSSDETMRLAREVGAEVVTGSPSRGGQIARALPKVRAEWVLILHADTVLGEGWCDAVVRFMSTSHDIGYFDLGFDDGGFGAKVVAGWANLRSRVFKLPYGDQGLLIKATLLKELGYPDQPLMEDVEFARRAKNRFRPIGYRIQSSFEKYQKIGWLRRGFKNLVLLLRYKLGADPTELARAYRRSR